MNCGCTGCRDHLRLAFLSRSSGRRWGAPECGRRRPRLAHGARSARLVSTIEGRSRGVGIRSSAYRGGGLGSRAAGAFAGSRSFPNVVEGSGECEADGHRVLATIKWIEVCGVMGQDPGVDPDENHGSEAVRPADPRAGQGESLVNCGERRCGHRLSPQLILGRASPPLRCPPVMLSPGVSRRPPYGKTRCRTR